MLAYTVEGGHAGVRPDHNTDFYMSTEGFDALTQFVNDGPVGQLTLADQEAAYRVAWTNHRTIERMYNMFPPNDSSSVTVNELLNMWQSKQSVTTMDDVIEQPYRDVVKLLKKEPYYRGLVSLMTGLSPDEILSRATSGGVDDILELEIKSPRERLDLYLQGAGLGPLFTRSGDGSIRFKHFVSMTQSSLY